MTTLTTPQEIFQKDDLNAAIEKIQHMFPKQAEKINARREDLMNNLINQNHLDQTVIYEMKPEPVRLCGPMEDGFKKTIGACNYSLIKVSFSVVSFICTFFGAKIKFKNAIGEKIWTYIKKIQDKASKIKDAYEKLDEEAQKIVDKSKNIKKLLNLMEDFNNAEGASKKAGILFDALKAIMSIGLLNVIWDAIYNEMTWWDWVVMVVAFAAKVASWVATAGAAFVALVAERIAACLDLGLCANEVAKDCICKS